MEKDQNQPSKPVSAGETVPPRETAYNFDIFDLVSVIESNLAFFLERLERATTGPELGEVDVSRLELMAMLVLAQGGEYTMGSLAAALAMPMSTATGIAERLGKKGLVVREKSPEDRRSVNIRISSKGQALVDKYKENVKCLIDKMSANLTREEYMMAKILARKMFAGWLGPSGGSE